jgi:hypothetical protein
VWAVTAAAPGLALTMHPPVKTGQMLVVPDRPWETSEKDTSHWPRSWASFSLF